jgi:uncharacterized small protein (DUF1192 family)
MDDQHVPAVSPKDAVEAEIQRRLDRQLDNLVVFGVAELSERWGVSKQRVDEIASTRLGKPWRRLAMGRIWHKKQITEFEKTWVRKSGRHVTGWQ